MTEYFHKAAAGGRAVRFSDKPVKVAGVTYRPRWAWSDDYRAWFRDAHGARRDAFNAARDLSTRTAAYLAWYERTHGRPYGAKVAA